MIALVVILAFMYALWSHSRVLKAHLQQQQCAAASAQSVQIAQGFTAEEYFREVFQIRQNPAIQPLTDVVSDVVKENPSEMNAVFPDRVAAPHLPGTTASVRIEIFRSFAAVARTLIVDGFKLALPRLSMPEGMTDDEAIRLSVEHAQAALSARAFHPNPPTTPAYHKGVEAQLGV